MKRTTISVLITGTLTLLCKVFLLSLHLKSR